VAVVLANTASVTVLLFSEIFSIKGCTSIVCVLCCILCGRIPVAARDQRLTLPSGTSHYTILITFRALSLTMPFQMWQVLKLQHENIFIPDGPFMIINSQYKQISIPQKMTHENVTF